MQWSNVFEMDEIGFRVFDVLRMIFECCFFRLNIFNHFYVCKKNFSVLSSNLSLLQLPTERSSRDYSEVVHTRLCLEDFYHFINLPNSTNLPNCNSYSGNSEPAVIAEAQLAILISVSV